MINLIRQVSDTIRIVCVESQYQVQVYYNDSWKKVRSYDKMEDDYAYTNANEYAEGIVNLD